MRFKQFIEAELPLNQSSEFTSTFMHLFQGQPQESIQRALTVGIEMALADAQAVVPLITNKELKEACNKILILVSRWLENHDSVNEQHFHQPFHDVIAIYDNQPITETLSNVINTVIYLIRAVQDATHPSLAFSVAGYCCTAARHANNTTVGVPYTHQEIKNAIASEIQHNPVIQIQGKLSKEYQQICRKQQLDLEDIEFILLHGQDDLDIQLTSSNPDGTHTLLLPRLNNYRQITGSMREIANGIMASPSLRNRLKEIVCRRDRLRNRRGLTQI